MTQEELYTALSGVCDTAYVAFREAVEPPFICYRFTSSADLVADGINYATISGFDVELYTDVKDPDTEASLEAALVSLGLVWDKAELYIESERLHEVVYSVQVFISASDESL